MAEQITADFVGLTVTERELRGLCAMFAGDEWKLVIAALDRILNAEIDTTLGSRAITPIEVVNQAKGIYWLVNAIGSLPQSAEDALASITDPSEK